MLHQLVKSALSITRLEKHLNQGGKTPIYTIKDECLGTFALDKDRESVIKELTATRNIYMKLIEKLLVNSNEYGSIMQNFRQQQQLLDDKIGQLCGHITNYYKKLNDMNLEEFTTTRIKGLNSLYLDMNKIQFIQLLNMIIL
jgi:hypothetical protein